MYVCMSLSLSVYVSLYVCMSCVSCMYVVCHVCIYLSMSCMYCMYVFMYVCECMYLCMIQMCTLPFRLRYLVSSRGVCVNASQERSMQVLHALLVCQPKRLRGCCSTCPTESQEVVCNHLHYWSDDAVLPGSWKDCDRPVKLSCRHVF